MELSADGLFLYASLIRDQIKEVTDSKSLIADPLKEVDTESTAASKYEHYLMTISSLLKRLPNGLGDIYHCNFARMSHWEKYKRMIALIAVAREPLLANLALQVRIGHSQKDVCLFFLWVFFCFVFLFCFCFFCFVLRF